MRTGEAGGFGGSHVEDHDRVLGLAQRIDVVHHSSDLFVHKAGRGIVSVAQEGDGLRCERVERISSCE